MKGPVNNQRSNSLVRTTVNHQIDLQLALALKTIQPLSVIGGRLNDTTGN